jgi:hypothetical protein
MQIKNWTMAFPTGYFTRQNNGIVLKIPGSKTPVGGFEN